MPNIENLNMNGFSKGSTAILYNKNCLETLEPLITLLHAQDFILEIRVLDEYSTDGSQQFLERYDLYKVKLYKTHDTLDRANKLSEIAYSVTETDWIIFFQPFDAITQKDMDIIFHVTQQEYDGAEFNYENSYAYSFRAIRTCKFHGFINNLIPELRLDLAYTNIAELTIQKEPMVSKSIADHYLDMLKLFADKEEFKNPEYWIEAYKYSLTYYPTDIKKAWYYLNKAEKLVVALDNPDPYTYTDIMTAKAMSYYAFNKDICLEYLLKIQKHNLQLRLDIVWFVFKNYFKDKLVISALDRRNNDFLVGEFMTNLYMMSSGEKDKAYWASMYYDRVWDEYIPGMLEWCKENNQDAYDEMLNKAQEINPNFRP